MKAIKGGCPPNHDLVARDIHDIQKSADYITDHILLRHKNRTDKTKPLIVLLGEHHDDGGHAASNLRILEKLQHHIPPYTIGLGLETPHTSPLLALQRLSPGIKEEFFRSAVSILNAGKAGDPIHAWLSIAADPTAGVTHLSNVTVCRALEANCSIVLGDLPTESDDNMTLVENDPSLQDAFTYFRVRPKHTEVISVGSYLGVHVRNLAMRNKAIEYINLRHPEIFIQACGNLHVCGTDLYPHSISLSKLFERAGYEVCGFVRRDSDISAKPDDGLDNIESVFLDGPKFGNLQDGIEEKWLNAVMPSISIVGWRADEIKRTTNLISGQVSRFFRRLEPQ